MSIAGRRRSNKKKKKKEKAKQEHSKKATVQGAASNFGLSRDDSSQD
jgi:hypothetical protein